MAELGGSQISSLMETLPGIALVLRSPVADAIVHLSKAAVRLEEFDSAHSEELLNYAVRRSLMTEDEATRVLADVLAAHQKRMDRAAAKNATAREATAAKAKKVTKSPKPAAAPKAKAKPKSPAKPKPPVVARTVKKAAIPVKKKAVPVKKGGKAVRR